MLKRKQATRKLHTNFASYSVHNLSSNKQSQVRFSQERPFFQGPKDQWRERASMQQICLDEFIGCQHYGHHILYLASAAAEVAAGWNDAQGQDLPAAVVQSSCVAPSSVQRVHPSSLVLPGSATPWPTNRLRAYRSDQQQQKKNYRTRIIQQIY